jgi:N-acetylmuramidase/TIR domain/Putative peptidoglycan binding domain
MPDVFISYHSEDRDSVVIVHDELARLKLDVWFDQKLVSGSTFQTEIALQLAKAKAALVCWTPGAAKSTYVQGEAEKARNEKKLVACFLAPTQLDPPFNVIQTEDLASWAGQDDNKAWLKILERIGELTDRPGLATYAAVMRPTATLPELRAWVTANAADPLSAHVWGRINQLDGENPVDTEAREAAEARVRRKLRENQAKRSRQLSKERGLRDPVAERRRWRMLVASVAIIIGAGCAGFAFWWETNREIGDLKWKTDVSSVCSFVASIDSLLIRSAAREKLTGLDDENWAIATREARVEDLQGYIKETPADCGKHLSDAQALLRVAEDVQSAQSDLKRLGLYRGPADGGRDSTTRSAIARFRLRAGLTVSENVDEELKAELKRALERWIHPTPTELRASDAAPPSEDDIIALAKNLQVAMPSLLTVLAVSEVESGGRGFDSDCRPIATFEPVVFQSRTNHVFDAIMKSFLRADMDGQGAVRTPWAQFEAAYSLDHEAAFEATSFGAFQMLGLNAKNLGFVSAEELARFISQSEFNQLEAFFLFDSKTRILEALRDQNWQVFARIYYGGNSAATTRYATRLAEAYKHQANTFASRPPWERANTWPSATHPLCEQNKN